MTSLVCLGLWLGLTLAWAPWLDLGLSKLYELALLTPFLVCLFVQRDPRPAASAILDFLVLTLSVLGALALVGGIREGRLSVLGGGPIVFGRNMGVLCLILFARGFRGRRNLWLAGGALLAFSLVVLSGSRGAMLATAAGISYLLIRAGFWKILPVLVLVGTVVVFAYDLPIAKAVQKRFEHRVVHLTLKKGHLAGRGVLYRRALREFQHAPIAGIGIGACPPRIGSYPHNLFLEVAAESGSIGLFLLVVFLVAVGHACAGSRAPPELVAILLLYLISAQFSGNLYDSRGVFLFGALVLTTTSRSTAPKAKRSHSGTSAGSPSEMLPAGAPPTADLAPSSSLPRDHS